MDTSLRGTYYANRQRQIEALSGLNRRLTVDNPPQQDSLDSSFGASSDILDMLTSTSTPKSTLPSFLRNSAFNLQKPADRDSSTSTTILRPQANTFLGNSDKFSSSSSKVLLPQRVSDSSKSQVFTNDNTVRDTSVEFSSTFNISTINDKIAANPNSDDTKLTLPDMSINNSVSGATEGDLSVNTGLTRSSHGIMSQNTTINQSKLEGVQGQSGANLGSSFLSTKERSSEILENGTIERGNDVTLNKSLNDSVDFVLSPSPKKTSSSPTVRSRIASPYESEKNSRAFKQYSDERGVYDFAMALEDPDFYEMAESFNESRDTINYFETIGAIDEALSSQKHSSSRNAAACNHSVSSLVQPPSTPQNRKVERSPYRQLSPTSTVHNSQIAESVNSTLQELNNTISSVLSKSSSTIVERVVQASPSATALAMAAAERVAALEEALESRENAVKSLQKRIEQYEDSERGYRKRIKELETLSSQSKGTEIEELKEKLSKVEEYSIELEITRDQLLTTAEAADAAVISATARAESLENEVTKLREELLKSNELVTSLTTSKNTLGKKLQSELDLVESLLKEKVNFVLQIKDLRASLAEEKHRSLSLENDLASLSEKEKRARSIWLEKTRRSIRKSALKAVEDDVAKLLRTHAKEIEDLKEESARAIAAAYASANKGFNPNQMGQPGPISSSLPSEVVTAKVNTMGKEMLRSAIVRSDPPLFAREQAFRQQQEQYNQAFGSKANRSAGEPSFSLDSIRAHIQEEVRNARSEWEMVRNNEIRGIVSEIVRNFREHMDDGSRSGDWHEHSEYEGEEGKFTDEERNSDDDFRI